MAFAALCRRFTTSNRFQNAIVVAIILNAILLGLETFPRIERDNTDLFRTMDRVLLGIFVVEILLRLVAEAPQVGRFFRSGWNVFDVIVVGAAFIPGLGANSTLLRLVRLARVARLVSVLPELRVISVGFIRSMRGIGGLALLTMLIVYVYAVLGWSLFRDEDPQNWGNAGTGMFTLFKVLTLEGWIEIYEKASDINRWAWLYFLSFILIATFVVLNMVIGVVLSSLEDARKISASRAITGDHTVPAHHVHRRMEEIRAALDELERELPDARAVDANTDR